MAKINIIQQSNQTTEIDDGVTLNATGVNISGRKITNPSNNQYLWTTIGYAAYNELWFTPSGKTISAFTVTTSTNRTGKISSNMLVRNFFNNALTNNDGYDDNIHYFHDSTHDRYVIRLPMNSSTNTQTVYTVATDAIIVTINYTDGSSGIFNIQIAQEPKQDLDCYFNYGKTIIDRTKTVNYSARTVSFEIVTKSTVYPEDLNFKIISDDDNWYSYNVSDGNLNVSISSNTSNYSRNAYIYIGSDLYTYTRTNNTYTNNGNTVCGYINLIQNPISNSQYLTINKLTDGDTEIGSFSYLSHSDGRLYYKLYDNASIPSITLSGDTSWIEKGSPVYVSSGGTELFGYYKICYIPLTITTNINEDRTVNILFAWVSDEGETGEIQYAITQKGFASLYFSPETIEIFADTNFVETNTAYLKGLPTEGISSITYSWDETSANWYSLTWNKSLLAATIKDVQENDSNVRTNKETLTANITLTDGTELTRVIYLTVLQNSPLEYTEAPIWKDVYYTIDYTNYKDYKYYRFADIKDSYKELYRGKILFIDENQLIDISPNNIAKDYLEINSFPFNEEWSDNNGYISLCLQLSKDGTNWEDTHNFHLYNNYSYEDIDNTATYDISEPILDYMDNRQYLLYSVQDFHQNNSNYNYKVTYAQENICNITQYVNNAQYTIARPLDGYSKVHIQWQAENGTKTDTIWQKDFTVKQRCKPYCLYYMTSKGGWSWMLFEGKLLKTSNITNNSYVMNNFNDNSYNYQNVNYLKEIKETWNLTTDYLTDYQSRLIQDLFTSCIVYLHILDEDRLVAVNITDSSVEEKLLTFNQGRKPYTYSITVQNSQTKTKQ